MKRTPAEERAERLAAALRQNLRRRKTQARGRVQESQTAPDDPGVEGGPAED